MKESNDRFLHEDRDMFNDALTTTAYMTRFLPVLIEKDYFCALALRHLASRDDNLVFKGGTCLAKVYAGFYRLSEDLDFVLPMAEDVSRSVRSKRAAAVKEAVSSLPGCFRTLQELTGANDSKQYIAIVDYESQVREGRETIKIEVGLREPLHEPTVQGAAQSLLSDVLTKEAILEPVRVQCISLKEALAEKFRAALTRRQVAVRDFYDIDYAVRFLNLDPTDSHFIELVNRKLHIRGNGPVDLSKARLDELQKQLDPQLKPVLRPKDFAEFDMERAVEIVSNVAAVLEAHEISFAPGQ